MSYNYNFHPKVNHPFLSNDIPQLRSGGFQKPFFFGGSQVPSALGMGFHKYSPSKTHLGELDFTTKKGDLVYHRGGHYVKETHKPYGKGFHKNSPSKTHKGELDFTTKKSSKVFHRDGHYVSVPHLLPFQK